MKNRWRITIVVLLLVAALLLGGIALYDGIFPVAEPICCPDLEDVTTVFLSHKGGSAVEVDGAEAILQAISQAEPTRLWSVNEFPVAEEYYTLVLVTPEREYRYYLYEEDSRVYVESPYEGVYQRDARLLETVAAYISE